jgi:hypothetical protein
MASFDEEVEAEIEQERLANEQSTIAPVNPVVATAPVAQPLVQAEESTDFDTLVNSEIEQERLAGQAKPVTPAKPEEPKEPKYITDFRAYGPNKDDEDVRTSLELLTPEERNELLKAQPWVYNKFTPEEQDEIFEESRKSKPITGADIASVAGSLLGSGVDLAKSAVEVGLDMANFGIAAPIKQAIKNKSWFEVKGENDILQAAKEKLDDDARNLSGAIPSTIIGTTRMIQRIFGGKDLNSIANPIQRAVATLAPNDIQEYVGQPIPDPNAGQINPWQLIPNTGIIPFDIVTKIASATFDKDAGGIAALDRLNEMLGIQDKDQSRHRDHIRRLYDAEIGAEDWKASNGQKKLSPWSQVAFSDIGQQAILFRERSLLPSVEFIAEHDGISLEQAQEKRNKIAETNAEKATIELTKEWNREFDPSMEFLGSLFLGDAAFGEAGLALGAGKLSGGLLQKASTLGMTDREVSRYYDALQKLEKAKMIARQRDMSKPSWWGKTAEYVEKKQDEVSAAGQSLFENLPAPVKAAAPLAGKALAKVGLGGVGGGVGALLDPENPSVGMLEGLTLTTALGVAPSVIRSVDRARRMIGAGEGKLFSEVAKSPESSLPARLIFNKATGPVIDYIAENSTALFKSGVNLGALSAVTSTLNSDDPEEFNQAVADGFGMGMGFHLAHGITGRIHGKDPAQDLKNRQKRDVEIYEAVKTASPATQGMLEQVSNYQTAIDRVDALVARSESNLEQATAKGDEKETKLAADALKNAMALQKEVLRANVQTRNEYGRSFLSTYADMNRLANGSRRAGQPNISIEILSPEQIADLYVSENSRQGMTPDEIAAVRAQGESYANERGYFDKARNRAVINARHVLDRTTLFGESPSDSLRHEGSHALDEIPEFQKLNENTDKLLFTKEEKDLQGNVLNRTEGIYDDQKLVDMYFNKYIGDRNQAEKIQFSQQLGLYNPETQQFNIPEIVKYMKSEVRAELSAGSLRSGLGKLMGAEATIANWVGMRQKQNLLARAIQSVTGLGGKPFSSSLLGIDFTPEVIAANKEAIKALADFNGRFDLNPEGTAGREMSEKEIRTNPVLRKRYGLAGGEFQTELKGIVRDANGKIVGTPVRIANPNAAEGNWTFDQAGNRKQTRGYGQVPDEFQGVQIPAGGSLEVYRDFVYEPDGKTPVATKTNDLANLETARGDAIRQALTDAIYDDSTTRLTPFSADGLSWSGIMSKSQVQAIKDIPESILPLSIKEKILAFNDTMARGDGSTFDFDYAPRLGRGKKYKGRKSNIYHVIPIGFGFSKAGNFYLRTLSLNAAFRKLKARAKLMDGWLTPWDNDPNMFMKELQEVYLNNTYEKRDGWLGLDPENPTEKTPLAEVKFGRFLDFMNMIGSDTPPNPQRATTPADPSARKRKTKAGAEEDDNQGIDNLWRSFRLDALADYVDTTEQTGRYRIDLDRVYKALMPSEGAVIEQQEQRRPATGGELAANLVESGTSLESFGKETLSELAEYYGVRISPSASRGEIIDSIQARTPAEEPALVEPQEERSPSAIDLGITATLSSENRPFGISYVGNGEQAAIAPANNENVQDISKRYVESIGIPHNPHNAAVAVNEDAAKRIADYYQQAVDSPNDPAVRKAYTSLANEVVDQWKAFEQDGYTAEPWTEEGQPYANSREMMEDVRNNKHIYYFTTESGFGESGITDKMRQENPMLSASGVDFGSAKNVPANDVFRVVHDIVGHGANGYEFGPKGELNAYLEHSRMFSADAKPALAAETLAQNSWVNYGPHLRDEAGNIPKKGERGYVPVTERPFADQKNIIIPQEFIDEIDRYALEQKTVQNNGISFMPSINEDIEVQFKSEAKEGSVKGRTFDLVHFGAHKLKKTDPKKIGKGYATRQDLSGTYKTYFYVNGTNYEEGISAGTPYIAKVDGNSIYDLRKDVLNVLGIVNREKMEETIKKAGYAGYYSPKSNQAIFDAVAMFKPVKLTPAKPSDIYSKKKLAAIEKKEALTKGPDYQTEDDAWQIALEKLREANRKASGMAFMPKVAVVPERFTGTGGEEARRGKEHPVYDMVTIGEKPASDIAFMPAGNVESEKFKEWFGKSEVVDEKGKPRVMYHGTDREFSEFQKGTTFFAFEPKFADEFANRSASGWQTLSEKAYDPYKTKEEYESDLEKEPDQKQTPVIVPVYVRAENIFDANNAEHMKKIGLAEGMIQDFQQLEAYKPKMEKAGFDAYYDYEYGTEEEKTGIFTFSPKQVKSATGNVGEYLKDTTDIRFMPAAKLDETYAKAIESGDMEEAQRLVDERAREAGYEVGHAFHGTSSKFNQFDPQKIGSTFGLDDKGFFFTSSESEADKWAAHSAKANNLASIESNTVKAFLSLKNPWVIEVDTSKETGESPVAHFEGGKGQFNRGQQNTIQYGFESGYDGIIIRDPRGIDKDHEAMFVVFNPNQIKSADPATYDNEGKLIPLSQRFDTSKPDIRFMPKSEEPEITEEGHVMPKTMDKPFAFTPQIAINFMPATEQVNLEDYLDRPIIALAADRMGIGQAYVGPTGAKQPLSMESQGGAGFSTLYRDEEHNPIWAFSKEQPALNFLKRINDVAEEYGVDSVLVAPTLLAPDNHLKNQTGQLGYVEAMEAALKAKMIKPSALNAQINEIIKRIAESKSPKAKQATKSLEGISTFAEFADAVRNQSFNFSDAEWIMKKAAQKKLPITAKELDQMGLLPSQIAKDLAHEGYYELPNFSVVSLFEVPKGQKPEKGMYHNAYPYIVRGRSIGYLKNIINLAEATKEPKVFTKKGQITTQPLMTVMPIIDQVLAKKALETLKAYTPPSK